jgi:hypothetical protein
MRRPRHAQPRATDAAAARTAFKPRIVFRRAGALQHQVSAARPPSDYLRQPQTAAIARPGPIETFDRQHTLSGEVDEARR